MQGTNTTKPNPQSKRRAWRHEAHIHKHSLVVASTSAYTWICHRESFPQHGHGQWDCSAASTLGTEGSREGEKRKEEKPAFPAEPRAGSER